MFLARVVSSLIMAPVVLSAIYFGWPWFALLLVLTASLMAWEWEHMLAQKTTAYAVLLGSLSVMVAITFGASYEVMTGTVGVSALLILAYYRRKDDPHPFFRAFGVPYICAPMTACAWLVTMGEEGPRIMIWLAMLVWATDMGGYAFGSAIGGPKLAPRISPGKTWSGAAGGLLLALALSWAMRFFGFITAGAEVYAITAVLSVVAQIGDLFESWMKRRLFIKDSSNLIPGHGGIFDRVDGLMFAAPALAAIINWWF